jgi:hypothetical protein
MIVRRRHTANFTTIGNKMFDDERLAADEVGILTYLLSRPHDWEVRRPALMKRWSIGREALRRIIRNLVRYGYCRAERKRHQDNGTTFVIYEIRDEPGPELTEEEARRALALESSAAVSDQIDGETVPDDMPIDVDPVTGQPSPVRPPPVYPSLAYISIQNKELTKDDSTKKIEREGEREKTKHALNLAEFKRRYSTTASDDQSRIDNAWFALTLDEGEAAIAGITPFLANLKRDGRKHAPAAWRYLGEKRWTLLEQDGTAPRNPTSHPRTSVEARALGTLYKIAGASAFFYSVLARGDSVSYAKAITPKLLGLAKARPESEWVQLTHRQAGAWEALLREYVFPPIATRKRLVAGDRAPWEFPPLVNGEPSSATGPPEAELSDQDAADLK